MGCVCEHRSDRGRFAVIFSVQKNMARQLRDAVRQLQNDAKDQLFLEYESQATFEYHHSQIAALRQAFSTLSDVVMGELSAIQAALAQSNRSTGALIAECNGDVVALKKGMLVLNDTLDAWSVKERGWAKDAELLKVSHAHLADWMQQVQRDVAALRDGMQSEKQRTCARVSAMFDEMAALKHSWDQQMRSVAATCRGTQRTLQQHSEEMSVRKRQRLDDLELLESAITTVQQQHLRLRASIDGEMHLISPRPALKKTDALESAVAACQLETGENRRALASHERDTKRHFDNIARVLSVLYGALSEPSGTCVLSPRNGGTAVRPTPPVGLAAHQ